jgi:hypothetical protein
MGHVLRPTGTLRGGESEVQQGRIDEFLENMPHSCHDCGRKLAAASMVLIEKDDIFVVCRVCAVVRCPEDRDIMEFAQQQGMKQITKRN